MRPEKDPIGRLKGDKLIKVSRSLPELGEKSIKDLGHEVPAWPPIKGEAIGGKRPCHPPGGILLVYDGHGKSPLCEQGRRGESTQSSTDDDDLLFSHT